MLEDLDDVQEVYSNAEFSEQNIRINELMTIILGIDPGSRITGYGLIKEDKPKN